MSPAMAQGKIINVKAAPYNAKGDGTTDDSAALQQAFDIATATPGNTVFIPAGTYLHATDIVFNANKTSILGVGRAKSILLGTGNFVFGGANFSVNGIGCSSSQNLIMTNVNRGIVNNCSWAASVFSITNSTNIQIAASDSGFLNLSGGDRVSVLNCSSINGPFPYLLFAQGTTNLTVKQTKLQSATGFPIYLNGVNSVMVQDCTLQAVSNVAALAAFTSTNITVNNTSFSTPAGQLPASYGFYAEQCQNIQLTANRFENVSSGAFAQNTQTVQFVGNSLKNVSTGLGVLNTDGSSFIGNQINGCSFGGISLAGNPTSSHRIERNTLRNCGLIGAEAVIAVEAFGGTTSYPVTVLNNLYSGNTTNITYFIKCECTAPPAVVRGNITTTMLPTYIQP